MKRTHIKRLAATLPLTIAAGTAALLLASSATALAFWVARAKPITVAVPAGQLPAGGKPVATVNGDAVTLEWPVAQIGSARAVDGYRVIRYSHSGSSVDACGGAVTQSRCVDREVPPGSWSYAVRPRHGTYWVGGESPRSEPASVTAAPSKEKGDKPKSLSVGGGGSPPISSRSAPDNSTGLAVVEATPTPTLTPSTSSEPDSSPAPTPTPTPTKPADPSPSITPAG